MEMMVCAGLTPYEVLVTGTRNPAFYFETPEETQGRGVNSPISCVHYL